MWRFRRRQRPLRIGFGRVFHEANARSPLLTERRDFDRLHLVRGEALARATELRGVEVRSFMPHAELTGFRQAARLAGDVEAVPLLSALAIPGGPLSRGCWEGLCDELLAQLERAGRLDGVYLALHGSMQVEGLEEAPESALLRAVQERVGDGVKLAASFDLHANLAEGMVAPLDVLVAYRRNPHWDLFQTGFRAGSRLVRVARGELRPSHAWRKLPMVLGGGTTIDFLAPMRAVFREFREVERDPRVISTSLFMVHPYTSAEHLGWSVHVSTNDDAQLADGLADRLADRVWRERHARLPPMYSVEEGIRLARERRRGGLSLGRLGPVVFVDVGDITGAGAPGGNTRIAEALLAQGRDLVALVPVHDPRLVAALADVEVGARVEATLRGTPGYGMPAVPLEARLVAREQAEFGAMLRLDVAHREGGALHLVVTEAPPLPIHPLFFHLVGLDPRRADVIVQKNFFHYRVFYAAIAFTHLPIVTPGATNLDAVVDEERVVPTEPKHALEDWRGADPILRRPKRGWRPPPAG